MRIDLFLLGYRAFSVSEEDGTAFFEYCRAARISPKGVKRVKKKREIRFFLTLSSAKRLCLSAGEKIPSLRECGHGGVPFLCRRLLSRPGMVAGVVLALFLLAFSGFFLFDVRVTGLENIPPEEMTRELAAAGLREGVFLPRLDTDGVAAALRRADGRVAYVTVNIKGTVAHVQIREATPAPAPAHKSPANLVAKCDGVITLPLVFEGECLVREGDAVRAGQLLASGMIDTENHGYRLTRAAGQILARTEETITVFVPFTYEKKVYTGKVRRDVSLLFFGGERKVFQFVGKNIDNCDIIEETKWGSVGGGIRLPVGLLTKEARAFSYESATRSAAEALALAREELSASLAAACEGKTLLSRTVETRVDESGVTLICTAFLEEDIARVVEIAATKTE